MLKCPSHWLIRSKNAEGQGIQKGWAAGDHAASATAEAENCTKEGGEELPPKECLKRRQSLETGNQNQKKGCVRLYSFVLGRGDIPSSSSWNFRQARPEAVEVQKVLAGAHGK